MIQNFKDIKVLKKAHHLVLEIYKATREFPKDEKYGLVSQVRRSAISICANICEGHLKTRKDFSRYLDIARGSLEETKYYLLLSKDLEYLELNKYQLFFELSDEIGKMLYGLKKSFKVFSE